MISLYTPDGRMASHRQFINTVSNKGILEEPADALDWNEIFEGQDWIG